MSVFRLGILNSHPIQYYVPLFRQLAARDDVDLTVFFCSDVGLRDYHDVGFGTSLRWDIPLVEGYPHEFLRNYSPVPDPGTFWGHLNLGIGSRLRAARLDALMVQGWARATNWLAFRAARALDLPLFLRGDSNGLSEPSGFRGFVKRQTLGRLFKATTGFFTSGKLNREFYLAYGADERRMVDAPFSVDNNFFRGRARELEPQRTQLRAEESIPEDATVFLFCGKIRPVKRPLDALEAFARLPDVERSYLVFAGDGQLRSEVERRTSELGLKNVRITGFLNQTELPRYYAMADVLLLPSGMEPWGLVVNEAMNFDLPLIVSDRVGAGPDLVRPGENGYIVPVGDIESLSRTMAMLAQDRSLRAAMGRRSGELIADWGIPQTADAFVRGLRDLVGNSRERTRQAAAPLR